MLLVDDVTFVRGERRILDRVTWRVERGQHWVILGANGSGKTSLMRMAAMYEHPSTGAVEVLGERLGRTDVRRLRERIGYMSAALGTQFRGELRAIDVVVTARHAALEPWWHTYESTDWTQARKCLDRLGVAGLAERSFATLSSGEQQRVLLARTTMNDPTVVLLDEPTARLDLGGREQLVASLQAMMTAPAGPSVGVVTHHVDEIPPAATHAMLLRDGRIVADGPIATALTSRTLSDTFDMPLTIERRDDGRLTAWST